MRARLKNRPLPTFKYRDFGNLVNLSEHGTVGNLTGMLDNRSVSLKACSPGSLYKMHQQASHGTSKVALDSLANMITRRTESRIKLH
jgi:NADH dehydrogenase